MMANDLMQSILTDPLAASRKANAPVGLAGFDLPLDLMLCGQRYFTHLPWQADLPTPQADRWLESSFGGWSRSLLQQWFDGAFDHFDSVVFSRGDDSSQRLYYYICELQRRGLLKGPQPLILDISQIQRSASTDNNRRALQTLLAELGLAPDALAQGMTRANACRSQLLALDANRTAPGHWYERITRAGLFTDPALLLASATPPAATAARRLLLAGSSPPDDRLHLAVEAAGWNVSGDACQRCVQQHGAPIANDVDPLTAVARHLNRNPHGPRSFGDRAAALIDKAQQCRADAVVLWVCEEDEALAWHVARQRAALAQSGLPHLILTRQRWNASNGAGEKITRFLQEQA